jgi:LmbE family N-acetylglucosaminyl deacetylase
MTMTRHTACADGVASLGRILTIWAHPDDESYLSGGLMAMARATGQSVTCIVATPGDHADTEDDRARIGSVRTGELAGALRILGVDDMVVLGIRDGECQRFDDDRATTMIGDVIRDRQPDTIVTFGADGFTGHPDHRAVSRWVTDAVAATNPQIRLLHSAMTPAMADDGLDIDAQFGVFEAGLPAVYDPQDVALYVPVDGQWLDTKLRALRAHHSQTAAIIDALGVARYRRWISAEVFVDARTAVDRG